MFNLFACRKNDLFCHKKIVFIFYETIISRACDFSNQEILSKMMLNAYSQVIITHSGFVVENQYYAICLPVSRIIWDIFTGMEKILYNRIIFSTFEHIVSF